ncbi:MAG TPA: DMT family transporter [Chitinophagaceae bacterium]|nr:DMT family transporter [Chitinophagaceae bacterium]
MDQKLRAHLAVLIANLIFGVNFSVVKFVTPGLLKPFGLNVVRVLVTTGLLWLMHIWEKPSQPLLKKDLPLFIGCGLTGVAINQLLFIKGLSITYSIHASLLMLCTPLLITISAFFFLNERVNVKVIIGLIVGIAGAILLITSKENSGSGANIVLGDTLIALNAISYTFYFILIIPLMTRYTPLQVLRWAFSFGTLFILPFGWTEFTEAPWASFTWVELSAIAFVVLAATFLAYLLNIYGLRHLQASATGSYIYLQPIFATAVAVIFLNEQITPLKLISAVLIFSGVYLVQHSKLQTRT